MSRWSRTLTTRLVREGDTPSRLSRFVVWACHPRSMENLQDALLLDAVQAWCDVCAGIRILLPAGNDDGLRGYCCTVCDAAVFLCWDEAMLPEERHHRSA
jgi:hypothetical protein